MQKHPRIEINPDVMSGKPVIGDTRITVEIILRRIADNYTIDEILEDYPHLLREDILAAVSYAADQLATRSREHAA